MDRFGADCLVVFDKDGTLIDFDAMWATWAETHAEKIIDHVVRPQCAMPADVEEACRSFRREYFAALDYDATARTVGSNGELACSPMARIYRVAAEIASHYCNDATSSAAIDAAVAVATEAAVPDPADVVPRGNLVQIFDAIAEMGAKMAVCTTDDRAPTEATLAHLGLTKYFVAMSCGDDGVVETKPSRAQIDLLCTAAADGGIAPRCTVMVGDTPKDMMLGKNAECDLTVGILGGASTVSDLVQHADCVVDSLERLPKLLRIVFAT